MVAELVVVGNKMAVKILVMELENYKMIEIRVQLVKQELYLVDYSHKNLGSSLDHTSQKYLDLFGHFD